MIPTEILAHHGPYTATLVLADRDVVITRNGERIAVAFCQDGCELDCDVGGLDMTSDDWEALERGLAAGLERYGVRLPDEPPDGHSWEPTEENGARAMRKRREGT